MKKYEISIDENDQLFSPDDFGATEFNHWKKTDNKTIKFYGHQAALKRLKSRLGYYSKQTNITLDIKTENSKTMVITRQSTKVVNCR